MNEIGIAVVGGGRIGIMHAQIVARLPQTRLVGVVIRSGDRAALDDAGLGDVPLFGDMDEAMDKADAVLIATSSDAHVGLIRRAATAGKHVLCEKPVAFEAAHIDALCTETADRGVVIQAGFNRRFDPDFFRLREMLREHALGRLYMLHIVNMDPRRPPMDFIPRSGGMFIDFAVHDFDMLAALTGDDIAEVYAHGANLVDDEIGKLGDIDTAVINIKMRSGALAAVLCSRETNCGYDQRIEVLGEKGTLRVGNVLSHGILSNSAAGSLCANPLPDFVARYRQSYECQILAFVAAVREGKPPSVGLREAAMAVRAAQAAGQSMLENRPVTIAL